MTIRWNEVTIWWNKVTKGWNEVVWNEVVMERSDRNSEKRLVPHPGVRLLEAIFSQIQKGLQLLIKYVGKIACGTYFC